MSIFSSFSFTDFSDFSPPGRGFSGDQNILCIISPPLCCKRFLCGILLCFLLTSAFARSQPFGTDESTHEERLVVVGAALAHDLVRRRDALLFLRYLLQFTLGVLPKLVCNNVVRLMEKLVRNEFLRGLIAGVEV